MIDLASVAYSPMNQAMRERVSGGSLFTGGNRIHKEGMSSRISFALALRLSIWRIVR